MQDTTLPLNPAVLRIKKTQFSEEKQHVSPCPSDLEVVGIHGRLFDDDHLAAFINSPNALLPWNGDQSLLIDRYDVRHLLDDLSGIRKRRPRPPLVDVTNKELDYERYRDLEGLEDSNDAAEDVLKSTAGYYHNVPFAYTAKDEEGGKVLESGNGSMDFRPPFPVPDSLSSKLPPSQKVHQIIAGTAKFVSEHGGQSEIILRVKQGDNPMFSFLNPDHQLHEYFRYLIRHSELVGAAVKSDIRSTESFKNTSEGLSLLGSVYGSSDDDDDDDNDDDESEAAASASPEDGKSSSKGMAQQDKEGNQGAYYGMQEAECVSSKIMEPVVSAEGSPRSGLSGVVYTTAGFELEAASERNDETEKHQPIVDEPAGAEQPSAVEVLSVSTKANVVEPPLQLKRVIDKMVEFIARNGKEFESVVKDRAKTDGRFRFLLPWNEYHPYYLQVLEAAQKVKQVGHIPEKFEIDMILNPTSEKASTSHAYTSLTEASQPSSGERSSNSVSAGNGTSVAKGTSNPDKKKMKIVIGRKDANQHAAVEKRFGMSTEAAAAAVRAATGRLQVGTGLKVQEDAKSLNAPESHRSEECGMSVDAAAAVVMAATRGARRQRPDHLDSRIASDTSLHDRLVKALEGSLGTGSEGLSMSGGGAGTSDLSKQGILSGSGQDDIAAAKAIVRAAALAAAHEADSADARLTPSEKLKAERLRRAKMFTAMIKSGQSIPGSNSEAVGSIPGVSSHVRADGTSEAAVSGSAQDKGFGSEMRGVDLNVLGKEDEDKTASMSFKCQTDVDSSALGKINGSANGKSQSSSKRHRESDHHDWQLKKQRSHHDDGDEDDSYYKLNKSCLDSDKGVKEYRKERLCHDRKDRDHHKRYHDDDHVAKEHNRKDRSHKSSEKFHDGNEYSSTKEHRRKSHRHSDVEGKEHQKKKKSYDEIETEDWEKKHIHSRHRHLDGRHFDKRDEKQEGYKRTHSAECLSDDEKNGTESRSRTRKCRELRDNTSSQQSEFRTSEINKIAAKGSASAAVGRNIDMSSSSTAASLLAVEDIPDDIRAKWNGVAENTDETIVWPVAQIISSNVEIAFGIKAQVDNYLACGPDLDIYLDVKPRVI